MVSRGQDDNPAVATAARRNGTLAGTNGSAPVGVVATFPSYRHDRRMGLRRLSGATVLAALVLAGCGNTQEERALDAAGAFYSAVADQDGASACDLLTRVTRSELEQSSGKPCDEAVLEEQIPSVQGPGKVHVFGTMAQAAYDADTVFLTRFGDRWLVVAAACSLGQSGIYDCRLEGS
jgi:hypothetical protein